MVDKKLLDIHYRHLFAKSIANNLDIDKRDEKGKDNFIIADVWNEFASGKGKGVRFGLGVNSAVKSISTYLYNEAVSSGELLSDIGDTWERETTPYSPQCSKSLSQPLPDSKPESEDTSRTKTNDKKTSQKNVKGQKTDSNKTKSSQNTEIKSESDLNDSAELEPTTTDSSSNIYKTDNKYSKMSKTKANELAGKDSRLEKLSGGKGWTVSESSFRTDVKYARKYTGKILAYIAEITGAELIVTSALGTGQYGNPHQKSGYASHHNAENPKLDLKAKNMSMQQLQKKLKATGFFSRVSRERTHLDVQIKPEIYLAFEQNLNGQEISQILKNNGNLKERLA